MSGLRRRVARLRRAAFVPGSVSDQLRTQAQQIAALTKTAAGLNQRLRTIEIDSNRRDVEHGRVTTQVGVLEQRLGALEQRLSTGTFVADDAGRAEARSLVEEVRREHEQVRVRMQLVSHYEERLRRVEEELTSRPGGADLRNPV
jgi:hypothetical protein